MNKISIFSIFFLLNTYAFSQKFEAGIITGINLSMLNEDKIGDHFGINTGLKIRYSFNENWAASSEILYSRNGEYALPDFYPNIVYDRVHLDYIEIPIQAEWKVYPSKVKSPRFTLGLAITSLIDFYADNQAGEDITEFVTWTERGNSKDLGMQGQLGILLALSKNFKFNLKISKSLMINELTPTLSMRFIWMFNSKITVK